MPDVEVAYKSLERVPPEPEFPPDDILDTVSHPPNKPDGMGRPASGGYRTSWTDSEILSAVFPEPNWVVKGLIPEGLTILGGRPKVGKSWMLLQIALAVQCGGKFLDISVESGNVLYLALEDNGRRLQERMKAIGWTPGFASVRFELVTPPLHKPEGMNLLYLWLETQNPRLVVIDTVERAMSGADKNDEQIMGPVYSSLQSLAVQKNIGIVMADHLRKPGGLNSDPVDDVIGSTAKTGIADTVIALYREQGKAGHFIRGRGREVDEFDLKIHFDPLTRCYQLLGDSQALELTTRRDECLDILRTLQKATAPEIAREIGQDVSNTRKRLNDLCNEGLAIRYSENSKVIYEAL